MNTENRVTPAEPVPAIQPATAWLVEAELIDESRPLAVFADESDANEYAERYNAVPRVHETAHVYEIDSYGSGAWRR